ncbi:hypothetical protein CC2G_004722 [Coprinopsis cinerea AmutBmut pab1-1]|nr:hypothetical protein CC2G_004722 [Coprinopsis cinerea AmutBmut pab1-1]
MGKTQGAGRLTPLMTLSSLDERLRDPNKRNVESRNMWGVEEDLDYGLFHRDWEPSQLPATYDSDGSVLSIT